jgi:hypothetical protein
LTHMMAGQAHHQEAPRQDACSTKVETKEQAQAEEG